MTSRALRRAARWLPNDDERHLLQAVLLNDETQAQRHWDVWRSGRDLARLDQASLRLLAVLYARTGAARANDPFVEAGRAVFLETMRRNVKQEQRAGAVLGELASQGISTMLLKGAAMNAGYYASRGVRDMADIDVLVAESDVEHVVTRLVDAGWKPDSGMTAADVLIERRVRHGWSFTLDDAANVDVHWRPIAGCADPGVSEMFWRAAVPASLGGAATHVPSPADQLLLTCAHAVQLGWEPSIRWIVDAMTIVRGAAGVDWERFVSLASAASVRVRAHVALRGLRDTLDAPVPDDVLAELAPANAATWERREAALQSARPPLSVRQSIEWHWWHFRRLRPHDARWRRLPVPFGFVDYVRVWSRTRTADRPASFVKRAAVVKRKPV